jgi:exodeoxyribonuclease V beta subunit
VRTYERKVDRWWRIGSFSAITSGASAAHGASTVADSAPMSVRTPEAEGRDRDEVDEVDEPEGYPADSAARAADDAGDPPVLLHDFPRGAKAGTLLHALLEDHDFTDPDPDALARIVREKVEAFGYRGRGVEPTLVGGLEAMLDTPLGIGARLRDIPRARRVDELEFLLPAAQGERAQVTSKRIAKVFAEHRTDVVPVAYVEELGAIGFLPLRGLLRGFVDLVFEHEGRFYVVDYKSNHLGPTASAYAPPRLATAMGHANYFLQYHLYTVAVHRWLGRRMRDYDYERCFGGVLYLFARGMAASHAAGTGIFFDRPTRAMVDALSEVLDQG